MCISAAQAQQECVDTYVVLGSSDVDGDGTADGGCYTDGTGYYDISWSGGCLATNLNYSGGDIDITANGFTEGLIFFGFEAGIEETIIITFEDGGIGNYGPVTNDCVPAECGNGTCEAGETATTCPEDCEAGECPAGQVADCDGSGECWTELWIGDTYCDGTAQQYGADLCCYELDGGDCTEADCAPATGACCVDGVCTQTLPDECAGTFAGGSCDSFPCGFTEGCGDADDLPCDQESTTAGCADGLCCSTVCEIDSICCEDVWDSFCVEYASTSCGSGGCPVGEVADCDGSGECWTELWIGDGYCDGTAQQYGADLCCYDNDGGDCTAEECVANVCGDGVCSPGETSADCPEDCDATDCLAVSGTSGETDTDGDGNPDECFADPTTGALTGYIELTWEGGCTAETIEFVGLGTLGPGAYASGVLVYGLGDAPICYDVIVTFVGGVVANTTNVCTVCGEPAVCGDGVCAVSESFETCPEDCEEGGCPDGQVSDCDGSGECWTETWIGDTYCDGDTQEFGANLCCYELDGGDCTAEECAGTGDPTGSCCVGTTCSETTEADCGGEWVNGGTCDADTCAVDCPTDLNGDGEIGGADLTILLASFGSSCTGCDADLNGDGEVGGADLTILLANFGSSCE
jgi:hypothetical protein